MKKSKKKFTFVKQSIKYKIMNNKIYILQNMFALVCKAIQAGLLHDNSLNDFSKALAKEFNLNVQWTFDAVQNTFNEVKNDLLI